MKLTRFCIAAIALSPMTLLGATSYNILGVSDIFAVLGGSTVTNTGASEIHGDVGVWAGSAITGFPPGVVTGGTLHHTDAVAQQAQADLVTSFDLAQGMPCDTSLTGQDLGGLTLTSGVYCFNSSAQLTGTVTFDAQGDPTALFLIQIGSTLTTASSSTVAFINGGQGGSVYWQVGSSATLGTTTTFAGNILALTDITLNTGANITCGRALARNGAVTLDTNQVFTDSEGCLSTNSSVSTVPEPSTAALMLLAAPPIWWRLRRRRQVRS